MRTTRHNQQGSAEAVVIACLVVVIVFALGWIFWQNFIHKDPETNKTSDITIIKQEASDKKETEDKKAKKEFDLMIAEWSVGADYDTMLGDLKYEIDDHTAMFVGASIYGGDTCTYGASGAITRYAPDDKYQRGIGGTPMAAKDAEQGEGFKKVGSYYYGYQSPQALCAEDKQQEQTNAVKAVQEVFANLSEQ